MDTYDASGNPTSYYNGERYTMTWVEGRRLDSVSVSDRSFTYDYNADGQRIRKSSSDKSYTEYYVMNGITVGESRYGTDQKKTMNIRYTLDENNSVIGLSIDEGSGYVKYYFAKNLQGDVLAVYRESDGTVVARYTYDSWGNVVHATGALALTNPFRYRSYYYDEETNFYYLQSRYYDAAIGRFINADDTASIAVNNDVASFNLFTYCGNNAVARIDSNGYFWEAIAIGFAAGLVGQYVSDVIGNINSGKTGVDIFKPTSSASDYLASGIGGAVAAIPGLNVIGTMAVGAVGSVVTDGLKGNINSWDDLGESALKGAVANGIGYGVSKGMAALKVKQIGNMSRSAKKVYLRDNFYCNSQSSVNANLKTFANSSWTANVKIIETQSAMFRSGIYSTVTSTITTLFS